MDSIDESSNLFNIESEKLESIINSALAKPELSISEIIQIYYQIMNVTSLAALLKKQLSISDTMTGKINDSLKFISEKFDSHLHHSIMKQLTNSISNTTKNLTFGNTLEKSKEDVESEAKLYEQLRQIMSTKEFVEQYDKGLSND
ncbi:MAG: hypothetical protein OEL81_05070 [Nitrosopumilus sp.]|nr:hypothetical protein [Nitrosopumilus sp.]MDH3766094.1 hypothetical protein [Nitrosopumilus sp.]